MFFYSRNLPAFPQAGEGVPVLHQVTAGCVQQLLQGQGQVQREQVR